MRTVNSFTNTAEVGASLAPRHQLKVQREILKFDTGTSSTVGDNNTVVPANLQKTVASDAGYATYKSNFDGNLYYKVISNMGTSSAYYLQHNSGSTIVFEGQWNQRADILCVSGSNQIFFGKYTGSEVQVRYLDLSDFTYHDVGSTIPRAMVNTISLVRRIEGVFVYRTSITHVIVAIGTHDFLNSRTTIEFFYVSGAITYQLDAIIQTSISEGYTAWWENNQWASYVSGAQLSDGFAIYANATPTGRGVMFTVRNGVESPIRPIFPIDVEQTDTSFVPYDCTIINGLFYLTGRYLKTNTDLSTTGFDMYLTSSDGENWSIGERSCYITDGRYNGKILQLTDPKVITYGGNSRYFVAAATPIQAATSDLVWDLTSALQEWSLDQNTNGADSANFDLAPKAGALDVESVVTENALVGYLKTWQSGDTSVPNFAVIGLDGLQRERKLAGITGYPVTGRDIASKRLGDWKSSFDIWMDSVSDIETDFSSDEIIQSKTPIRDIKTDEEAIKKKEEKEVEFLKGIGLRYRGLNSPYVGFFDKPNMDGIMEMRINFKTADYFNKSAAYAGFVFGASEDKNENIMGNMLLFPKYGTWSGAQQRPFLAKFNLNAIDADDPTKVDTGLKNLAFRTNPLVLAKGDAAHARTTVLSTVDYRMRTTAGTNTMAEINKDNMLLVRTFGRKVQYFMKHVEQSGETSSDYAFYEFLGEGLFDNRELMRPAAKNLGGLVLGVDTYSSKDNFEQGQYGDITSTLTQVSDMFPGDNWASILTKRIGVGKMEIDGPDGPIRIEHLVIKNPLTNLNPLAGTAWTLPIGYFVGILTTGGGGGPGGLFRITADLGVQSTWPGWPHGGTLPAPTQNDVSVDFYGGFKPNSGTWNVEIFVWDETVSPVYADQFGWASSKTHYELVKPVEGEEYFDITDPKAIKRNNLIYGRGIFVTEDNSALSERYVRSDGIMHEVLNSGYSGTVWDILTNPLEHGGDHDQHYNSTSNSKEWRLMLYHGKFFDGDPATFDLPAVPFYFIVDDELIRARKETFVKPGYGPNTSTGVYVPVFYRSLAPVLRDSPTLTGWASGPNKPGDNFAGNAAAMKEQMAASGSSIAGLLVEINTRNIDDQVEKLQYYAVDASAASGIDVLSLDKAYKGRLTELEGIAIVSGRGQFGTIKEKHPPESIVCYAPIDQYGTFPEMIIPKLNYYVGNYFSTEDAIEKACTLAGQRDVKFRTMFTSGNDWTGTLTNGTTTLPLVNTLKNFDMKANLYIPGNSRASSPNYKLNIGFRLHYKLVIQQWNDDSTVTDGHYCNMMIGLATDDASIPVAGVSAPSRKYGAERWLRGIVIPVKKVALSGVISGSSGSWSYSNDQTGRFNLRVVVNENNVYVELEGQHLMTFNLDDYPVKFSDPSDITIYYDQATLSASATIHIGELGDPFSGFAIQQNSTARSTIDDIIKDRSIFSRSTQNGGIEFSQFMTRDNPGNLQANLIRDTWTTGDNFLVGHILMAGTVNANYFDSSVLGSDGYKFDSLSNTLVTNTQHALREAKLSIRRAREQALQRAVSGYGRTPIQPEDKVTLVYSGLTAADYVVNSITFNASKSSLKSEYNLRKYVP